MNAATAPGAGARPRRRPVPWRRLAWVTVRQRRVAFAGAGALLGVIALYLLIMAFLDNGAYRTVAACHPAGSALCHQLRVSFRQQYWGGDSSALQSGGAQTISSLLLVLPVLLGAFVGAPLLARELETGTFRFAWTQGAGRTRWALSTLVLPAVVLTAATLLFTLLFSWYYHPFLADGQVSSLLPLAFGLLGVAFAAWTLLAYALSVFTGVLFRRTVPAMGVTLIAWTVLAIGTATSVRQHYASPVKASGWGNVTGWVTSQWVTTPSGAVMSRSAMNSLAQHLPSSVQNSANPDAFTNWMSQHGYTQWAAYEPGGRFLRFQLIEGGWLLALCVILLAASVWLVRRRAA